MRRARSPQVETRVDAASNVIVHQRPTWSLGFQRHQSRNHVDVQQVLARERSTPFWPGTESPTEPLLSMPLGTSGARNRSGPIRGVTSHRLLIAVSVRGCLVCVMGGLTPSAFAAQHQSRTFEKSFATRTLASATLSVSPMLRGDGEVVGTSGHLGDTQVVSVRGAGSHLGRAGRTKSGRRGGMCPLSRRCKMIAPNPPDVS